MLLRSLFFGGLQAALCAAAGPKMQQLVAVNNAAAQQAVFQVRR